MKKPTVEFKDKDLGGEEVKTFNVARDTDSSKSVDAASAPGRATGGFQTQDTGLTTETAGTGPSAPVWSGNNSQKSLPTSTESESMKNEAARAEGARAEAEMRAQLEKAIVGGTPLVTPGASKDNVLVTPVDGDSRTIRVTQTKRPPSQVGGVNPLPQVHPDRENLGEAVRHVNVSSLSYQFDNLDWNRVISAVPMDNRGEDGRLSYSHFQNILDYRDKKQLTSDTSAGAPAREKSILRLLNAENERFVRNWSAKAGNKNRRWVPNGALYCEQGVISSFATRTAVANAFLEACICYFTDDIRRNNYMETVTSIMNLPPDALAEELVVVDEKELEETLNAIQKSGVFQDMAAALNESEMDGTLQVPEHKVSKIGDALHAAIVNHQAAAIS